MPHFYFHLQDGRARLEDRSGVSLPDAEAAWYQAYRNARELLAGDERDRRQRAGQWLQVEDEGGLQVWTVALTEIAELSL
ncbi:MAG: hypothetical protein QOI38_878 [Sphingomonadales bacterium]|jgi:hypothetical protein|nr:hypothetical protein [Sphingomonadales bacterium]